MHCPECYNENPDGILFCERCGFYFGNKAKKADSKCLKDRYKIVSYLSSGEGGSLLLAYDVRLSKACAVKQMQKKGLQRLSPEKREKIITPFKREAELLATLRHPGLPCITDYFIENDIFYLVMDYIEGKDLEVIMVEREGGIDERQVMEWAIQVCGVLEYLHGQKPPIIHGDLKLANLILRNLDGYLVVVDFTTSSLLEILKIEEEQAFGTAGYAPPEQYTGRPEERSDIYSLGATMYELLTGNLPDKPFGFIPLRDFMPDISAAFEAIVMKCLEYKPENRFFSVNVLKQNLLELYNISFGMVEAKNKSSNLINIDPRTLDVDNRQIKVFMVDDDVDMCNSFEEISKYFKDIELTGVAYNGKKAIEVLSKIENKPDIVLMDMKMPVMNGIETTKKVREILPLAKIVILSAYLEEKEFWECFKAGATGYILKGATFWGRS